MEAQNFKMKAKQKLQKYLFGVIQISQQMGVKKMMSQKEIKSQLKKVSIHPKLHKCLSLVTVLSVSMLNSLKKTSYFYQLVKKI